MRILGQLLVWASLAAGAISAATAYMVDLTMPEKELVGLTLAGPPKTEAESGKEVLPLYQKNQELTAELLGKLREKELKFVHVKEFSLRRWPAGGYFLLAMVGLLVGASMTRLAARPKAPDELDETEDDQGDSPGGLLHAIQDTIDGLRSETSKARYKDWALEAVVDRLGKLQKTEMAAFVDKRPQLVAVLGLAGYAGIMDIFAAAERQINRAWSAAVDQAYAEAIHCLDEASELIADTRQGLAAGEAA